MNGRHKTWTASLAMVTAAATMLLPVGGAAARTQLNLVAHFGGNVNQNGTNTCFVATETCNFAGTEGTEAGWFAYAQSVAVDQETHAVYVADKNNNRIDKLGANGEFILMWGWKVNKKGGNVCTKAEEAECKAGESGGGAEQMTSPQGVAVDQATHHVYVLDYSNHRVDEFGPNGEFILMFGGEVNKAGPSNVCPQAEASECQAGKEGAANGFFMGWPGSYGSLLSVGGPTDLVYVADEGRVQEFNAVSGAYAGQLSLALTTPAFPATGEVSALTVDSAGDIYVTESRAVSENSASPSGVHEFGAGGGTQIAEFDPSSFKVEGMTLDPEGRLTVTDAEPSPFHGALFKLSGPLASEFGASGSGRRAIILVGRGLSYNDAAAELYTTRAVPGQEVNVFAEVITPEAITGAASEEEATSATVAGEVNAESAVLTATSFFEYGRCTDVLTCAGSAYGQTATTIPAQELGESNEPVTAHLKDLFPNQLYHYRLAARNNNGTSQGTEATFETRRLPPAIEAAPEAPFVRSESVVLSGAVNPENAATHFHFEYGPCEPVASCASATPDMESSVYGDVGITQEITSLSPATTYHVRLVATNVYGETTPGPESTFATGPAINPQLETGPADSETATSAVITGAVNPDGAPATYAFELGTYAGGETRYGIVSSGSVGTAPALEKLQLTGLQPGTEYAYRIAVSSSYVQNEGQTLYGATRTFRTVGLPSVLTTPPLLVQLPVPNIKFPARKSATVKRTRAQKLRNALKACKAKRNKKQRVRCKREARAKYGVKPKKGKAKKKVGRRVQSPRGGRS